MQIVVHVQGKHVKGQTGAVLFNEGCSLMNKCFLLNPKKSADPSCQFWEKRKNREKWHRRAGG